MTDQPQPAGEISLETRFQQLMLLSVEDLQAYRDANKQLRKRAEESEGQVYQALLFKFSKAEDELSQLRAVAQAARELAECLGVHPTQWQKRDALVDRLAALDPEPSSAKKNS